MRDFIRGEGDILHPLVLHKAPEQQDFGLPFLPSLKSFSKATEINLLYANAFPEPVFKYFSKSRACFSVSNPAYHTSFHGICGFVDGTLPELCSSNRSCKLFVEP